MIKVMPAVHSDDDVTLPPQYSDDALAETFSAEYGNNLRYVPEWSQWMAWDNSKWSREADTAVFQRCRMIARRVSAEADASESIKIRLASATTSASIEREARGDPRHSATSAQWDLNPWLLNTPSGTVDLCTGKLQQHRKEDYLTKSTAVGPGGECSRWISFIDRITDSNTELQRYLQRFVGYSLTGSTREQAMAFLWGTGKNGKSVFINTISAVFGDYAKNAPMSTFTSCHSEQHPTDVAGLRGARLVTAIETEEGRTWAESRIKALTGGDPITARFMRQDFWTYIPTFKLIIAGNHKPTIRSVDEAMRRRINLIPFTVWIPEEERDKELEQKLKAELPGILQWAIEGCLEWQRIGLQPPQIVIDATKEYFDAEDVISRWIDDRCECGRQYECRSSALFKNYKDWCENTGERPRSQKKLSQALAERGFTSTHTRIGSMVSGIALKEDIGGGN